MAIRRISPTNIFIGKRMDSVGDGTGTTEFNEDFSGGSATVARFRAPENEIVRITRTIIWLEATADFQADRYVPTIVGDLSVGINVEAIDANDALLIKFTEDEPIHTLGEYGKFSVGGSTSTDNGNNTRYFSAHFAALGLVLVEGEAVQFTLNDDFSGLKEHRFLLAGIREVIQ